MRIVAALVAVLELEVEVEVELELELASTHKNYKCKMKWGDILRGAAR